jgi:hypothetical protein
MFGRQANARELPPPPDATRTPEAAEILRAWAAPGKPAHFSLRTTWQDPAAWGLMLADLARHAAQAYERDGRNPTEALARIRAGFDAEWTVPTDTSRT